MNSTLKKTLALALAAATLLTASACGGKKDNASSDNGGDSAADRLSVSPPQTRSLRRWIYRRKSCLSTS